MSLIDIITKEKLKFRPETGFNVCGIDQFEPIGERLYLLEHFDNKDDAENFINQNLRLGDDMIIISSNFLKKPTA